MDRYHDYHVSIQEIHHKKKLDAPSGTAIALAGGIVQHHSKYKSWCFLKDKTDTCIPIDSIREGEVPGTHTVTWDSEIDTICLSHEAKNRKGFAFGAVVIQVSKESRIFHLFDLSAALGTALFGFYRA